MAEASPREALEAVALEALQRAPCFVSFSGGRDSSAVLAVAAHVARREGLDPPVPVTQVFPDSPRTWEHDWQRLVMDHLGLHRWEQVEIRDELDYLGPVALSALVRHGQLYPSNAHFQVPALELAAGGTLLTGWGGDDLFGTWRLARLPELARRREKATLRDAGRLLFLSLPAPVRRSALSRFGPDLAPWLTPAARRRLASAWASWHAGRPRRYDAWADWLRRQRHIHASESTYAALAEDAGARVRHPLVEPRFLSALARAGGWLGLGDRTSVWRALFADLLPAHVLERTSKAFFGDALLGPASRRFLDDWQGEGSDPEVVDWPAAKAAAHGQGTTAALGLLIQGAWLARFAPR